METAEEKPVVIAYNPLSLVHIFNNALTGEATRKIFRVEGIYMEGKGTVYGGVYMTPSEKKQAKHTSPFLYRLFFVAPSSSSKPLNARHSSLSVRTP